MVFDNISANYPVYATFHNNTTNHACVIYGVAPGGDSMLAMNPEMEYDDPYDVTKGNLVSKDDQGFFIAYGATKLYLYQLCAKIWS